MQNTFLVAASAALIAATTAHLAVAQTLPAAVQADRSTIQQDATRVQTAFAQLRADEQAGNAAATAADRTALRLARMQAGLDFEKLHQDAQGIIQADQATLMAALTQLHADQTANNAHAIQADETAVRDAEMQLRTDRGAVFGDLGSGFGLHNRQWHG